MCLNSNYQFQISLLKCMNLDAGKHLKEDYSYQLEVRIDFSEEVF